jgi:CubicO group peptidase (beta-lactamase class C family)
LNVLKSEIENILRSAFKNHIFPGAAVGISAKVNDKREDVIWAGGESHIELQQVVTINTFFDLASLTKPLATTLSVLSLINESKVQLDESLSSLLSQNMEKEKEKIKLRHLLCHASGLPPYREYFKELSNYPLPVRKEKITEWILNERCEYEAGSKTVYSDLGFILLGIIIEKKSGKTLDAFFEERITAPLGLENKLFFRPLSKTKKETKGNDVVFAATEKCEWRKKTMEGEVHDDNAYILGGVAGHAGLFGNIEGVLDITKSILSMWQGKKVLSHIDNKNLQQFLIRQDIGSENTWAMGFDTPSDKGSSSGTMLDKTSVGHLGFTGTSFWIDPIKDLIIVLLTNRIHPSRENGAIKEFRPLFHDIIARQYLSLQKGR